MRANNSGGPLAIGFSILTFYNAMLRANFPTGSPMREQRYTTPHGIVVSRTVSRASFRKGLKHLTRELDHHRGIYLSSGYEFPGRYSRWDTASLCPPLEIVSFDRRVEFHPLNQRGRVITQLLSPVLASHAHWEQFGFEGETMAGRLKPLPALFPEEERSRQPSVFSILRALIQEFTGLGDSRLGLIGAFGYDFLFQFEPIQKRLPRHGHKDLHLYLCDDIYFMDRKKEQIERCQYDFSQAAFTTNGLPHEAAEIAPAPALPPGPIVSDHTPQEYMANVETVREGMRCGDYYEVVLRQTFRTPYAGKASDLFERVQIASPSPYEFLLQFGDEQLVGASRNRLVFSYVYQFPHRDIHGFADKLLNGWQSSGIVTFQNGFPVPIESSSDLELMYSSFFYYPGEPNQVAPLQRLNPRGPGNLAFNTAAFQQFTPDQYGTIGDSPRSVCCGPGINNVDFSLMKDTVVKERYKLEFRAEFFNIANHAQFTKVDGNISDSAVDANGNVLPGTGTFGKVLQVRDPRLVQFALKLIF